MVRTVGALTRANYERASRLKVGVIGCGRSGSLLTRDLARFGIRQLVVVDPDRVERGAQALPSRRWNRRSCQFVMMVKTHTTGHFLQQVTEIS